MVVISTFTVPLKRVMDLNVRVRAKLDGSGMAQALRKKELVRWLEF